MEDLFYRELRHTCDEIRSHGGLSSNDTERLTECCKDIISYADKQKNAGLIVFDQWRDAFSAEDNRSTIIRRMMILASLKRDMKDEFWNFYLTHSMSAFDRLISLMYYSFIILIEADTGSFYIKEAIIRMLPAGVVDQIEDSL